MAWTTGCGLCDFISCPPLGPLSGSAEEEKQQSKRAFGSHDIQTHSVIGHLKKVTIALEGEDEGEEGGEVQNGVESSLEFTSLDKPSTGSRPYRYVGGAWQGRVAEQGD